MNFTFSPRTDEYFENQNKFKVYLNYLKAFSDFLSLESYDDLKHLKAITNTDSYKAIRTKTNADKERIKRLLRNSWFTEIQLNFSKNHPEFVCYSNHWVVIQVYYTVYLSLRALFVAMNKSISSGHDKNLDEISYEIQRHPELFPEPWNITCSGDPANKQQIIFNNLPATIELKPIEILASNNDFWDCYTVFLKTTRKKQIEEKRKKNPYKSKKRLSPGEKTSLLNTIPPTTIFNCLYRLRIRANYQDVEPFLMSIENQKWAAEFNCSIRHICGHTLQVIEFLIARNLGKNHFMQLVNDFVKDETHGHHDSLKNRWDLLASVL